MAIIPRRVADLGTVRRNPTAARPVLAAAAVILAVLGTGPTLLWLAAFAAAYVVRDPGRLLDACLIAAFCGLGYLAG